MCIINTMEAVVKAPLRNAIKLVFSGNRYMKNAKGYVQKPTSVRVVCDYEKSLSDLNTAYYWNLNHGKDKRISKKKPAKTQ